MADKFDMGDFRFAHSADALTLRMKKYIRYFQQANAQATEEHPVLDLGCGRGFFLELLSQAGLVGLGVDASPEALAEYKNNGGKFPTVEAEILAYLEDEGSQKKFSGCVLFTSD